MTSPAKREDRLALERAVRALEDIRKSLKEFSTTDAVKHNATFAGELKIVRQKAKKLQERVHNLVASWTSTFESKD